MTDLPLFRVRNSMSWWAKSKTWLYQEETSYLPWTTACGAIRSIWWSISFLKKKLYTIFDYIHIDWADAKAKTRKPLLQQAVRKPMLVGSAKATILAAKDSQRSDKHRLTQLAGKACENHFGKLRQIACLGKEIMSRKVCKVAKIYTIRILKEEI